MATFADLSGRRAVVTGASSGIGRAIALELARGGADVVVHCRQSRAEAESVADAVRQLERTAHVISADLIEPANFAPLIDSAWQRLGGIDIWINNAGADLLTGAEAKLSFEQKLQLLLDVDVRAPIILGETVGRRMVAAGSGVILNIGWDQADRGMEGASGELFAASKNAVMGFTRSLAVSLAPSVRVNCIAPGWIRTSWGETAGAHWQERVLAETPLKRWGQPEDVARMVRFLCSSDADYITGQVIRVNGGAER